MRASRADEHDAREDRREDHHHHVLRWRQIERIATDHHRLPTRQMDRLEPSGVRPRHIELVGIADVGQE
jgi:hypothetical protein